MDEFIKRTVNLLGFFGKGFILCCTLFFLLPHFIFAGNSLLDKKERLGNEIHENNVPPKMQETTAITGRVGSEDDFPMPGASIVVKGKPDSEKQFKVRALWVNPPGLANRETIDRLIVKCKKARINTLIPDIMLRDNVYFQSENFFGKVNADQDYDPLAYLIEAAHEAGIEVHPWSCVYYVEAKKPEWVSEHLFSKDYGYGFLSPAHPEVNPYILSVLKELLKYDIDGIHIDYARYHNAAFDYSETARNQFSNLHGFDPGDFLDHPERIVPQDQDPYPVRILVPVTMEERVWELGHTERTMNRIGLGYAMISEKAQNIDRLAAPGMLLVSYYTNILPAVVEALQRYVERGGDVVWINPGRSLFSKFPYWKESSGVTDIRYLKTGRESINPEKVNSIPPFFNSVQLTTSWSALAPGEADIIAKLDSGEPVITSHQKGKGSVTTCGFPLMQSNREMETNSEELLQLFRKMILSYKKAAGIPENTKDMLAEKRNLWIDWRASHIHELVRELNIMVKSKDPKLKVTAAAGIGPGNYYGVYRNGEYLLTENLCDFLYPMNYVNNIESLREMLDEQRSYIPQNMAGRIYPGLRMYVKKDGKGMPKEANMLQKELEMVKKEGYEGFCLFSYSLFSDEIVEVLENFD